MDSGGSSSSMSIKKCGGGGGGYLKIGGRYLSYDFANAPYFLSGEPQPLNYEEIPIKKKGLSVFRIDPDPDGDDFHLVTVGILSNFSEDDEIRLRDCGMTWVAGDEILFNEISKQHGCFEEVSAKEVVYCAPLVVTYPKTIDTMTGIVSLAYASICRAVQMTMELRRAFHIHRRGNQQVELKKNARRNRELKRKEKKEGRNRKRTELAATED